MSRIFVAGLGAVSPAGWNVAAMRAALAQGKLLPAQPLEPRGGKPLLAHLVPPPATRPEFLSHPRLRRASAITHYSASAALEAAAGFLKASAESSRLGLVACFQSGCVQYSCRFYDEALKNPATASPLLFPETVYAAPASHVAALLKNVTLVNSLVGDPSSFLHGIAMAAQWLVEDRVDACLVIGAEETNWITADALRHLDRPAHISAGAGALCLCREEKFSIGVELAAITDAHPYTAKKSRTQSARSMRDQLTGNSRNGSSELLCDGLGTRSRTNTPEMVAWQDWAGPRISLKRVLGEGLMAAAAWQCVAACDAVTNHQCPSALVSLVGFNQQAMGAKFGSVSHLSESKTQ
jgi:hypothetical protein